MVLFILLSMAAIIPVGLSILSGASIRSIQNNDEMSSEQDSWLNERLARQLPIYFHIGKPQTDKSNSEQCIKIREEEYA